MPANYTPTNHIGSRIDIGLRVEQKIIIGLGIGFIIGLVETEIENRHGHLALATNI